MLMMRFLAISDCIRTLILSLQGGKTFFEFLRSTFDHLSNEEPKMRIFYLHKLGQSLWVSWSKNRTKSDFSVALKHFCRKPLKYLLNNMLSDSIVWPFSMLAQADIKVASHSLSNFIFTATDRRRENSCVKKLNIKREKNKVWSISHEMRKCF